LGTNDSRGKASGLIDRTLIGFISLLKETVSNDEVASRDGFLQKRDPRLKCLSIVLLLFSVLSTRSVLVLGAIYLLAIALALISAIKIGAFLKRTLFFIPLFSLFIVIPAIFSFVTPGESVAAVTLGSFDIAITRQGIDSATIFFLRVLASVSLAVVLVLTTRHHVLLKVLRSFRIPQIFVMTMSMTYRYIYLLLDIAQNTFIAIKSRVGFIHSTRSGQKIVGANISGLWLKSYRLQTQVYSAMISRGYTGEPRILEDFQAHIIDFIVLISSVAVFAGTIWLNQFSH
jgi:cobalt/nickel transport system permease protein